MRLIHTKAIHPETGESLEIEFEHWPATKGSRDSEGHQLEPDEPSEIVIRSVTLDGDPINFREIEEVLINQIFSKPNHNHAN